MTTTPASPPSEAYAFRLFASSKPPPKPATSASSPFPSQAQSTTSDANAHQRAHDHADTLPRIRLDDDPFTPQLPLSTSGPNDTILGKRTRPSSYYFAAPPDEEAKTRFRQAAVEGSDVRLGARRECPGLRLRWRVVPAVEGGSGSRAGGRGMGTERGGGRRVIFEGVEGVGGGSIGGIGFEKDEDREQQGKKGESPDGQHGIDVGDDENHAHISAEDSSTSKKRKCRRSKATRIGIRIRLRAVEEGRRQKKEALKARKIEEKQKDVEKEAHLKEKKAKMNRKKQIKKREKKRVEKGVGDGDSGG